MTIKKVISRTRPVLLLAIMTTVLFINFAALPTSVRADGPITVNSLDDTAVAGDSNCTLREAINNANDNSDTTSGDCAAGSGIDTIVFDGSLGVDVPIVLSDSLPSISDTAGLTINGESNFWVDGYDGATSYQVFLVKKDVPLTLDGFDIMNGAGIYNNGIMTFANGMLGTGYAYEGGGVYNDIYGTLNIVNSTFLYNGAQNNGGGVYNNGMLNITKSTFRLNASDAAGGGVYNNGVATIANSTFTQNNSVGGGGGVYNAGILYIRNSTFKDDKSTSLNGEGVYNNTGVTSLINTIINSLHGGDCYAASGTVTGYNNLISGTGSSACGLVNAVNGNIIGSSPALGARTGNPAYFPITIGSPALNAGYDDVCASAPVNNESQNGATRPQGVHCDIGSYEYVPATQTGPTFTVNTTADTNDNNCAPAGSDYGDQDCSLREAINLANATSGANTIVFDDALFTATLLLDSDLPDITDPDGLTIEGGTDIIVNGNGNRGFSVSSGALFTLNDISVEYATGCGILNQGTTIITNSIIHDNSNSVGGGIFNNGTLTITNSQVNDNAANEPIYGEGWGGGLFNIGTATITNSSFSNNEANKGGGAVNQGTLTIVNSSFSNNSASMAGGGIYNGGSSLTITDSTFSNNSAGSNGGGFYSTGSSAAISNSTFNDNRATNYGGGLYNNGSDLTITNSTISANTALLGDGIYNNTTLNLYNTILANSINGRDCRNNLVYGIINGNNNLVEATGKNACGLVNGVNGNIVGFDPALGALTGTPAYFPLNSSSPAIDAGDDAICSAAPVNGLDQRGVARPQSAHCDIGAYEKFLPPGAFNKTGPADGVTNQPDNPTLSWGDALTATSYEYCLNTDASCSGLAVWTSTLTSTSVDLSGLTPGTWYWQVRANNVTGSTYADGETTWWSFTILPAPGAFNKTGPADGAANQPNNPTLSWGEALTATSYEYCLNTEASCSTRIGVWTSTLTSTSVDLSGLIPGTWYWQVRANKSTGSSYANGETAWWSFTVSPAAPANVQASDGTYTDKVRVTWTASSGATSYKVYRATSATGAKVLQGSPTGTTFDDTTPTPGITYTYWVVAYTGTSDSGYSTANTGWRKLLPPTSVLATDGTYTDKVRVSWVKSLGATSYKVYRATSAAGAKVYQGLSTGAYFDDTTATPGITYTYWVVAYRGASASGYSTANTGWRKLTAPVNVQASDGTYTTKVLVTWTTSTGATSYKVYRAATATGAKTLLGSPTVATFNDTTATPGVTYYYWVVAYRGASYSANSTYNTGWRR